MKVLNQEAIRRMINGGASSVVAVSGGGGGGGGLSPAWVEENYVSKTFFNQLFTIHGTKTVTDEETGTTTVEEVEITPNQLIDDEYGVTDVEVKFGLWTQQFLSALGKSSMGGGGDTLTEPLASINNAGLGTPTAAGQAIVWNGKRWTFGTSGGGSVTSVGLSVPTGFTVSGSPVTSAGTIQLSFASDYSLPTTAKQNNWDTAYGWGNHANAGYLTSSDIQDMATKTWVTGTALSGYATRNWVTGTALNGYAKLTDNVASATKLQTAHKLWGNQFDGTQDIDGSILMRNNSAVRIYDNNNQSISLLTVDSDGNFVIGETADIYGHNTFIRGANFYWQQGTTSANRKVLMYLSGSGNLSLRQANAYLGMQSSAYGILNVLTLNTATQGDEYLALGYGIVHADYVTRIYGGGGDDKGIRFYHGTTLAASVQGGDHSFILYYNIKLTTNNQGLYTRNTNGALISTILLNSNNILNFGYGCSTNNHETRIYGGATAGIGFFCGSTEVASVYRNVDSNQNVYQGIRIGNALLSWDSTNNALKVQRYDGAAVNFYSLGGVSALGFTAPQSSLESFRIDYLTSTNISTQTVDVATQMNLGSANCNIKVNSSSLTINAPAGLTLVTNSGYGLRASRFYLDATRYIYLDGTTLKYYNGSQSKTIVLS